MYKCEKCGSYGCKLWRNTHNYEKMWCANCIGVQVDAQGMIINEFGEKTDQIKGKVPAVPTFKHDNKYWAYTAAPEKAVLWWKTLPSHIE